MLPLARALAGRYANRGEPLDDLVQVACVGIMKAIDGFDISREVRFSSYATPTVLGEIKRHFRDKTWAMRVPRGLQELQLQVAKARDKLTNALARRAHRRGRHAGRLAGRQRSRDRARRDARAARRRVRRAVRARPGGAAAALRAGHDPDRDRPAHRGQPDAGLAPDPPVAGAAADGHRTFTGSTRPGGPRLIDLRAMRAEEPRAGGMLAVLVIVAMLVAAAPASAAPSTGLVVNEVYGAGGNSGATYTNDFVEIANRGSSPVS